MIKEDPRENDDMVMLITNLMRGLVKHGFIEKLNIITAKIMNIKALQEDREF